MPRTLEHEAGALALLDLVYRNQLLVNAQFTRSERDLLHMLRRRVNRIVERTGYQGLDRERIIHGVLCCVEIGAMSPDHLAVYAPDDVDRALLLEAAESTSIDMVGAVITTTCGTVAGGAYKRPIISALAAGFMLGHAFRDAPPHLCFRLAERVLVVDQPNACMAVYGWLARINLLVPEQYGLGHETKPPAASDLEAMDDDEKRAARKEAKKKAVPEALALRAMLLCEFESIRKYALQLWTSEDSVRRPYNNLTYSTEGEAQTVFYQLSKAMDERLRHPQWRSSILFVDHTAWNREGEANNPRHLKELLAAINKAAPSFPLFIRSKTGVLGMLGGAHVRHALRRASRNQARFADQRKVVKRPGTFSHEIPSLCSLAADELGQLHFTVTAKTINGHAKSTGRIHEETVADYYRELSRMPATPPAMFEDHALLRVIRQTLETPAAAG